MRMFQIDALTVEIYENRVEMGQQAAAQAAQYLKELLAKKDGIRVLFAAAPSQLVFLENLVKEPGLDWSRVTAFHMDEYVGLSSASPGSFGNFLGTNIFSKLPMGAVHYINGDTGDIATECRRYAELIGQGELDAVFMGIGENGHIAFNDPAVADFEDRYMVKAVALDEICRRQQVNEKCFPSLDEVPQTAITLTVPTLISGGRLFCIVPFSNKAEAVKHMLEGEITADCPASILRRHKNAVLYLDRESAAKLDARILNRQG